MGHRCQWKCAAFLLQLCCLQGSSAVTLCPCTVLPVSSHHRMASSSRAHALKTPSLEEGMHCFVHPDFLCLTTPDPALYHFLPLSSYHSHSAFLSLSHFTQAQKMMPTPNLAFQSVGFLDLKDTRKALKAKSLNLHAFASCFPSFSKGGQKNADHSPSKPAASLKLFF